MKKPSIIVYGPQACGKTTNAEALAKHFGLNKIHDEWMPSVTSVEKQNTLILTNEVPTELLAITHCKVISFNDAMRQAGLIH